MLLVGINVTKSVTKPEEVLSKELTAEKRLHYYWCDIAFQVLLNSGFYLKSLYLRGLFGFFFKFTV